MKDGICERVELLPCFGMGITLAPFHTVELSEIVYLAVTLFHQVGKAYIIVGEVGFEISYCVLHFIEVN